MNRAVKAIRLLSAAIRALSVGIEAALTEFESDASSIESRESVRTAQWPPQADVDEYPDSYDIDTRVGGGLS